MKAPQILLRRIKVKMATLLETWQKEDVREKKKLSGVNEVTHK